MTPRRRFALALAICVSAGKIGHQVECDPNALIALLRAKTADVIV